MDFILPPRINNPTGDVRRVGFEIEFGGLSLQKTAEIILSLYGGRIVKKHNFSFEVKETSYGDFALESDSRFLSKKKYDTYLRRIGVSSDSSLNENVEKLLEKLAGTLLPFEIAMPPIPITDLQAAEKIRKKLYESSAQGISSSIFAAFGMQLNPEVPDLKVQTLLSYLRAFFLLYDWLIEESQIAIARKVAPFIHPFPQEYIDQILDPAYQPDLRQFMRDYLELNPTRNRPLDLLPLFAYLDFQLVLDYPVEKDLIKPRPTFHYRLPNSEIDDPGWSFAKEWNKWILVENLSVDSGKMDRMSADYFHFHKLSHPFPRSPWISRTREWIDAQT